MKTTPARPFLLSPAVRRQLLSALLGAVASSAIVHAASDTWSAPAGGDWTTPGNWTGGNVPGDTSGFASADIATFGAAGGGVVAVDAYRNVAGITFSNGASAYTLNGGNLVLTAGGIIQIAGTALSNQVINSAVNVAGNATFTNLSTNAASSLKFGGNISGSATTGNISALTLGSGTSTVAVNEISGVITDGLGGGTLALSNVGAGRSTWTLSGANTYTGGTTIGNAGKLLVTNSGALGTGTVTIGVAGAGTGDMSSLQLSGGINVSNAISITGARSLPSAGGVGAITNLSGNNTLTGNITGAGSNIVIFSNAGKLTLTGSITNSNTTGSSGSAKSLNFGGAGDGEISGRISRSDGTNATVKPISLNMNGTGTWVISNSDTGANRNDYRGTTTVTTGTLLINADNSLATGAITVNAGATFGGSGINGGVATFAAGSFLSPGASAGVAGTSTFNSTVDISALTSGSGGLIFHLDTVGSSDRVALSSGVLTLGTIDFADFNFTALSGFGEGTYTLFDTTQTIVGTMGSSVTGTVGGFNVALAFANSNQDVVLTVTSAIPEPSTWAGIVGALALTGAVVYRRRR